MELDFSLECNEVSSSEFWSDYDFGMVLGSLYFKAQCCVPVSVVYLALKLVGSWVELGFSVVIEAFG